jgi:hypothetical protein
MDFGLDIRDGTSPLSNVPDDNGSHAGTLPELSDDAAAAEYEDGIPVDPRVRAGTLSRTLMSMEHQLPYECPSNHYLVAQCPARFTTYDETRTHVRQHHTDMQALDLRCDCSKNTSIHVHLQAAWLLVVVYCAVSRR